jgi:Rab5 GDP/GTP exchange factor
MRQEEIMAPPESETRLSHIEPESMADDDIKSGNLPDHQAHTAAQNEEAATETPAIKEEPMPPEVETVDSLPKVQGNSEESTPGSVDNIVSQTRDMTLNSENMEASTATIKASETKSSSESTAPPPPPKDGSYLDPTPKTPLASEPPTRTPSRAPSHNSQPEDSTDGRQRQYQKSPRASEDGDSRAYKSLSEGDEDSKSEIQSIMDQFDEEGGGPGVEEVMSPRLELTSPYFPGTVQHPPRKSSLEPIRGVATSGAAEANSSGTPSQPLPSPGFAPIPRASSMGPDSEKQTPTIPDAPLSPTPSSTLHNPPPPDSDLDLPFDFHRFLEQLRHRSADPVARFLRSFLSEFGKKQWMVHEQVKIISDFLTFIANKMGQCDVWRGVSDAEFDNAREGMEKLVMNRLYSQTFSPAIPPPAPSRRERGKQRGSDKQGGLGRRGQHQEDVERDEVLAQKVAIYGWVREEHLDIKPVGESGRKFLTLAQQGNLLHLLFLGNKVSH